MGSIWVIKKIALIVHKSAPEMILFVQGLSVVGHINYFYLIRTKHIFALSGDYVFPRLVEDIVSLR